MMAPSEDMRLASQGGTRPPCKGRIAVPERLAIESKSPSLSETYQNGAKSTVGAGGIIFQASNELHNVTNVGQTPATYYVIGWTVPTK